jgi:hypothetical protein
LGSDPRADSGDPGLPLVVGAQSLEAKVATLFANENRPVERGDLRMSIAEWMGLPEEFQTTLLLLAILLTFTPYFAGIKIGGLQVPDLGSRKGRLMKVLGPLALLASLGLVLPVSALLPSTTKLQILAVDFTQTGEIDVAITNAGTATALLTKIEFEILKDHQVLARPVLAPTGHYRIPLDDLQQGQRRSLILRHTILPATTERILLAPEVARSLDIRMRIYCGDGGVLTADVQLWPQPARALQLSTASESWK